MTGGTQSTDFVECSNRQRSSIHRGGNRGAQKLSHPQTEESQALITEDPRISRARKSGSDVITAEATVAVFDAHGKMDVLLQGSNDWVCVPGNENKVGEPPMCMNPMGMQWMMDAMARKPKPTNTAPGIIYMLCGATQHSTTNPEDHTSPVIPIGPHWMVTWPYDAHACGLPAAARDAGAWVMFDGTPYAYLHICGDPRVGNEYRPGDKAVWTMRYESRSKSS